MSSVWDTLNAVRARRAAAESSVKKQGVNELAKKQAAQHFTELINEAVEARLRASKENERKSSTSEAGDVISKFDDYCRGSVHVSNLVKHYQTSSPVSSQISSVKTQIRSTLYNLQHTSQTLADCQNTSSHLSESID